MKILVLIDAWFPFVGGAQIQIKNLERILARDYHCSYYVLHSPSVNMVARFLWSFWVIPQAIILNFQHHFDLIHSHAYWPGISGKFLAKLLRIPVVFTIHGSNLLDLKVKSPRALLEKIILTKIRYSQVISVSSNFLQYKNINKNIKVIPNGVDVNKFKSKKEKRKIKSDKKLKILSVGRDDPVKGWQYLEKAMKLVKKKFPHTQLKIIKKGYFQKTLIKEYLKADVFVLPSLSEGQPVTLLEAWAAKLPVVVTAVGDNPKMVEHGENGFLVRPGDINGLAKMIMRVLKNPKRDLIGKKGYQLVKEKYSWEQCANKTYQVYQNLVDD